MMRVRAMSFLALLFIVLALLANGGEAQSHKKNKLNKCKAFKKANRNLKNRVRALEKQVDKLAAKYGAATPMSLGCAADEIEFKTLLSPSLFPTDLDDHTVLAEAINTFWEKAMKILFDADGGDRVRGHDTRPYYKKTRQVSYYDTPDRELRKNDLLIRIRDDPEKGWDYTYKIRGKVCEEVRDVDLSYSEEAHHAEEAEIVWAADVAVKEFNPPKFSLTYSNVLKLKGDDDLEAPEKIKDITDLIEREPDIEWSDEDTDVVQVNGVLIEEVVLESHPFALKGEEGYVETQASLTLWYITGCDEPDLAEVSFGYAHPHNDPVTYELAQDLILALAEAGYNNDESLAGSTKTKYVYDWNLEAGERAKCLDGKDWQKHLDALIEAIPEDESHTEEDHEDEEDTHEGEEEEKKEEDTHEGEEEKGKKKKKGKKMKKGKKKEDTHEGEEEDHTNEDIEGSGP